MGTNWGPQGKRLLSAGTRDQNMQDYAALSVVEVF